jgi:pyruvate/2-oxoglutarate dehydrogenase complex dihydrolipoamide dehydrogenase (E3) component
MTAIECQNLVIGSGEGGKFLAWNLATAGESTIVVERALVGGSCPNVACLPSKNVLYSAKAVSLVAPEGGLGVTSGSVRVDPSGVLRRKRRMIEGLMELHQGNFQRTGAELLMGEARFIATKAVEVALNDGGTRQVRGERVFINVGSRAAIPDIPGLQAAGPMTHVEALNLERLPEHLVILGGGYVGLEFAQALRRFGSAVTILQRSERLLDREDPDVSQALLELMQDEGIHVLTGASLLHVAGRSGEEVELRIGQGPNELTLAASDLLAATGRIPNTDRLDAAQGNVRLDSRGFVQVNEQLQTSAEGVWALGDCAGSPLFTHVGFDDFRVVLDQLRGGRRTTRERQIPYCLFTDPELAHVGLSETQAQARGIAYRLATLPMSLVMRMHTLSQTRGFCKALLGEDDRILGFTAFGAEASEMLAAVQTAMLGGLSYQTLRDAIFTHPTASEGLIGLFSNVPTLAGRS